MLFGLGVLFACLMSSMGSMAGGSHGAGGPTGLTAAASRVAGVDLRLRMHEDKFDVKSLIPKHPPVEVKSMKVVGASGIGIYFPANEDVAAGIGVTAFKYRPGKRALQAVLGLRFRF
jgi:hypothetical protein